LLGRRRRKQRLAGGLALMVSTISVVLWVWAAPPQATTQHMFNLMSPSHEGAFMIEVDDLQRADLAIEAYLRDFDQHIQKTPKEMLGTRVLSNPPGLTVLFYGITTLFPPQLDPPGWSERLLAEHFGAAPEELPRTLRTMQYAAALLFAWALAAPVAYALGRLFLPPTARRRLC
jgi:hypothetical protein